MPIYYPVYLNLEGKLCVIIGGGAVAEGKIAKLLESGARITLISPDATPFIQAAAKTGELEWRQRKYQPGDLAGAFIGVAATGVHEVSLQIFEEAEERGVLLNVVDDTPLCTFIAPSIVKRGAVTLAISTGGTSPALARKMRESLAGSPALEWADLAGVLSQARQEVKTRGQTVDTQRWQCCITPHLLEMAQAGREDEALAAFLSDLLDGGRADLCPNVDQCRPEGCPAKPGGPAG
jgi:siroheme synthase-like protein